MAVLAPMPRASEAIAAAAKPGRRRSCLSPYRRSWSDDLEPADAVPLVDGLANRLPVAELADRGHAGLLGAHASRHVVVGLLGDVMRDLLREVGVPRVSPEIA